MRALFALAVLLIAPALPARAAGTGTSAVQSILLGDTRCDPAGFLCTFRHVRSSYGYLHAVVHALPGSVDWRVLAGPSCASAQVVASGTPVPVSGYLEEVVPVVARAGTPGCYVLKGSHGGPTFYALYFDDSAQPDADSVYPGYQLMAGRPDLPDLDIAYIHRSPALPYDGSPNEPSPGQAVQFQAHLINSGGRAVPPFPYKWLLDGHVIQSGTYVDPIPPGGSAVLAVPWFWLPGAHMLQFVAQPPGPEISTSNDTLSVRTNALTLGFWVEQSAYDYFRDHQWAYCRQYGCWGSDSFEDWLQRQVTVWNHLLAGARDPEFAPAGITDRVRVDEITVVPNGTLPLDGGMATDSPDRADHSVDLQWGMPATAIAQGYALDSDDAFHIEWSLLHELGHARSLADVYRFDVSASAHFHVTDAAGQPALDVFNLFSTSGPMRAIPGDHRQAFLYRDNEDDLMGCACNPFYSPYSALLFNRIQGRRAQCGNFNPPCNLGDWFLDIPPVNRIHILDSSGHPVADGTEVKLFFDEGRGYNGHAFDDTDSLALTTTGSSISLPPDPFHDRGSTYAAGRNILLLEIRSRSDTFCFLEPATLNLAYWLGYRDRGHPAQYVLTLGRQVANGCSLHLPAPLVNEPFATSPYASTVSDVGRQGPFHLLRIHLVDAAVPPHNMRARLVRAIGAGGQVVARAITDRQGLATLQIRTRHVRIVDVTDNNLPIEPLSPIARR